MTEQPPPPPGQSPPRGDAPQTLHIDGILDGRVLNEDTLRAAVQQLGNCGAGTFRVDVTGGRFSVLPVETVIPGAAFDVAAQTTFLDRLQSVADAAQPGSVETNLRCKLVYDDEVAETLFVMREHSIEPVSRRRPVTAQDRMQPAPLDDGEIAGMSRRRALLLAPLLLLAGIAVLWQSGWLDRAMSKNAQDVQIDTGAFADMLAVELTESWGNYTATLTRGEGYPRTPAALDARIAASEDLAARAACELVGKGDELFVQLMSEDGTLLFETQTGLRPLLTDAAGKVEVKLRGHRGAHRIHLSLSSAK